MHVQCRADLPEIVQPPENMSVPVGRPANFTCVAIGNPAPDITWLFNSVVIPGAQQASYMLANVTGTDAGTYTCVATNTIGIAHIAATLTPICEFKVQS